MIKLLHRLGFDSRKPKGLPAKADAAAQEAFVAAYETLLNGLLPDEIVYFGDAVHPEYQSRPAHGWVRRGAHLAVKRGKGRERMNLMGALCLETFDLELIETLKCRLQRVKDREGVIRTKVNREGKGKLCFVGRPTKPTWQGRVMTLPLHPSRLKPRNVGSLPHQ